MLRDGWFNIQHISTADMVADFLTKGLQKKKHLDCLRGAGMHTIRTTGMDPSRGGVLKPEFGEPCVHPVAAIALGCAAELTSRLTDT